MPDHIPACAYLVHGGNVFPQAFSVVAPRMAEAQRLRRNDNSLVTPLVPRHAMQLLVDALQALAGTLGFYGKLAAEELGQPFRLPPTPAPLTEAERRLADALGLHLDGFQRIVADPASMSVIRYTPVRPFVVHINHTGSALAATSRTVPDRDAPVDQARTIVIAYEPIWAVGTGEVATPADAQEVCAAIRALLASLYDAELAAGVRVLYGGSVKSSNVAAIMAEPDVDGALVGGASLDPGEFAAICRFRDHIGA